MTVLNRGRDAVFHCNGAAEVTGANPLCIDPIIIIIIVIDINFVGAGSRQCVVSIDHLGPRANGAAMTSNIDDWERSEFSDCMRPDHRSVLNILDSLVY